MITFELTLRIRTPEAHYERAYTRLVELPFAPVPGMEWPAYQLEPHRIVVERVFLDAFDDGSYGVELAEIILPDEETVDQKDAFLKVRGWTPA